VSIPAQLPLALPHRPAFGGSDFLVADANRAAVAWLDAWPDWPSPGLVVWGETGCGKTHLAATWQLRAAAVRIAARELAVADVPSLLGPSDPVAWLHLHPALAERGGHMLLTARAAPARWQIPLPDLASRLRALAAVEILPPDESLVEAVLVKHFADRQLRVPAETVRYVVTRLDRSLEAVAMIAAALDAASLAGKRPASIPLAREVLRDLGFAA
jgi:chromosomal replication initiation ATPase DnaA